MQLTYSGKQNFTGSLLEKKGRHFFETRHSVMSYISVLLSSVILL